MRREHDVCTLGNLLDRFDGDSALCLQVCDDVGIMNDLVLYVDRRSVTLKGDLDDVYGANDSRTEATWCSQKYLQKLGPA